MIETAALRVGHVVMRHMALSWLAETKAEKRRGADLTELIAIRFGGLRLRSRNDLKRKLDEVGDIVGERLRDLCLQEFPTLPDHERVAALDAVVDTLQSADLGDATLLGSDLDPIQLARDIRGQVPSAVRRAALNEAGHALFDLALDQACAQLVYLVRELPEFESRTSEELLRRSTTVLSGVERILDRLPRTSIDAPSGADHDERFRLRYLDLVARHYGDLELVGLSVRNFRPRTTLSVAYLGLTVSSELPSRPAREAERVDAQDATHRRSRVEPALSTAKRHLIRGDAGSGKTTLLRWLAVSAARRNFTGHLASWNGYTPFLIKLRSFAGKALPRPEEFPNEPNAPFTGPIPDGWVHRRLLSGEAVVLVDGVDELAENERPKVRDWLNALLRTYPDVPMVVTARPLSTEPEWLRDDGFESLSLQRMSPDDIERFTRNWHQALLDAAENSQSFPFERAEVDKHGRQLLAQLKTHQHLRNLASNPLMCTMICALHLDRGGNLPPDRNGLYDAALDMLLHRRDNDRVIPSASTDLRYGDKLVLLQAIAWWLSLEDRSELGYETALGLIERTLTRMPNHTINAADALEYLLARSGVIRAPAEGQVDFVHRTFQEYLAAREAADAGHVNLLAEHARHDQWSEIIIMASSLLNRELRADLVNRLLPSGAIRSSRFRRLLAVACRNASSELPTDLLDRLKQTMWSLVPPENPEQARQLATLGEPLLEYLPRSLDDLPSESALSCVLATAMVGGEQALDLMSEYASDDRASIQYLLFDEWRFFEPQQYARVVLDKIERVPSPIVISEPDHAWHLAKLGNVQSTVADFSGHMLSDLNVLEETPRLQEIRANMTGEVDLAPLRRHKTLNRVDIRNAGRFTNTATLQELPSLHELWLYNSQTFEDITFVSTLVKLEALTLGKLLHVDDFSPLRELPNLRWLELRSCIRLSSLDDILHMNHLTRLAITGSRQNGLSATIATHLPGIRILILNRTSTSDLRPLGNLPLEALWLNDCPVRDLMPLADMPWLTELHLQGCREIEDIEALARIPHLKFVDLSRAASHADLTPLARLEGVTIRLAAGQYDQRDRSRRPLRPSTKVEYV